jgi:hypothetical protein
MPRDASEGVGVALTRAYPYNEIDGCDPYLAVPDLAGPGRLDDGRDDVQSVPVVDQDLDLDLRHQVDGVFRATVDLGVALLPAEPADSLSVRP